MKRTKFYNIHKELGAKIIDFAGYQMPVMYSSMIEEHKTVRHSVGVFDVSHMGEVFIRGEKALDFVQHITVNNAENLTPGRVQYSAMCFDDGGIVDDLLVYKISDEEYMLVINASNIEKDILWMKDHNHFDVLIVNESDDYSLLAVQGPYSKETLQKVCDKDLDLEYYHFFNAKVAGVDMIVSRTGYTGELGYELYFKGDENIAEKVWTEIFEAGKNFGISPVGLGARDTLRLEMGYCLYGNDIDQTTNPLEAGLGWITKLKKGDFIGRDAIAAAKEKGLERRLSAMISSQKAFPRPGYEIKADGKNVGKITSGTLSPFIEKPIALGYLDVPYNKEGTKVSFVIRGKEISAEVIKLPFVKK